LPPGSRLIFRRNSPQLMRKLAPSRSLDTKPEEIRVEKCCLWTGLAYGFKQRSVT
jgi:hypothetical protein